jgi:hypothetical protein
MSPSCDSSAVSFWSDDVQGWVIAPAGTGELSDTRQRRSVTLTLNAPKSLSLFTTADFSKYIIAPIDPFAFQF